MTTPTLVATEPTTPMSVERPTSWVGRLGRETAYALIGFPIAIASFTMMVTGLSLGAGLLITLVGFPVLTLTAYVARGFAHVERGQLTNLLGHEAPTPRYRRARSDASILRRIFVPLGDPQTWLDIAHGIVTFVTSTISFTVVVTWWSVAVAGVLYPLWGWAVPRGGDNKDLAYFLGLGDGYTVRVVFYVVLGLLCLVVLPFVVRAMAALRWMPARAMLAGRGDLQQQIEDLEEGRQAARAAEASSLRRLERDIHDGPQQRLVRLSMDLGRARKQAADGSPTLVETLDGALAQTRDTLDELRALSRGIAPPILADRGLRAAIEELAARSVVPIDVAVELPDDRLPAHAETAAYFVASEALTNVAKHSGAHRALLSVRVEGDRVRVRVTDDGRGGAHLSKGRGLLGLSDRVRAADGVLNVTSPVGGPTIVDAEIPCAS
jgi:signal transduction histidine kinase